jgi:hypothetical protein
MAGIVYSEDVFDEFEVSEEDIAACSSQETLVKWRDDLMATMADIIGQVELAAMGGNAPDHWVYRASKATGYFRRALVRVETRLKLLGWHDPYYRGDVPDLTRKLAEAKARGGVAIEFLRICQEGGIKDRALFNRLEAEAVACVDRRLAKKAAKKEAA